MEYDSAFKSWVILTMLQCGWSNHYVKWNNKTKKGQTFCDSTSMRKWNHLKASQIRRQKKQKVIPIQKSWCFMDEVSLRETDFLWHLQNPYINNWNHMQSNESIKKLYNLHQIHSNFSTDKMQSCVYSTSVLLMNFNKKTPKFYLKKDIKFIKQPLKD